MTADSGVARSADVHEYLAFEDPDEYRTWVFDLTFLTSSWGCVFGRGCPGVHAEPTPERSEGCCTFGAHFVDDADHDAIRERIEALTDEQWQFRARGRRTGATRQERSGTWVTRVHQGACIMLNRPEHPGGAGCALHRAALEAGERPIDWKPDVCWQLPLRLDEHVDDHGHVTSTVREWKRRDWGDGGSEFGWWCTDDALAFDRPDPVWKTLADELIELIGERVYLMLARQLQERATWQHVDHPVLRRAGANDRDRTGIEVT